MAQAGGTSLIPDIPYSDLGEAPPPPAYPQVEKDLRAIPHPDGLGICFPAPLDDIIRGRLIYLDEIYPRVCQAAINVWGEHIVRSATVEMNRMEQDHQEGLLVVQAERDKRFRGWELALLTTMVAVGAGAIFFFIGYAGGAAAGAF
jgi:hypothetical protein